MVGGFIHLEKYWSMGRIIPYIMENKKSLKPPTSDTRRTKQSCQSHDVDFLRADSAHGDVPTMSACYPQHIAVTSG